MAITTRGNINASGELLQIWLNRTVLENFEPQVYFRDASERPMWQSGYNKIAWTRFNRLVLDPAAAALTEGVTPADQDFRSETIEVVAEQYGLFVTISDFLSDTVVVDIIGRAAIEVGNNLARIIDFRVQEVLESTGTNALYGGAATSRVTLAAGDNFTAQDAAKAQAFLAAKAAPLYDGSYVAIIHPNVAHDLQIQGGANGWTDLNKYTSTVTKVFNGELGALYGVRFVVSANVKKFAGAAGDGSDVYPSYIMGRGSYGVSDLQSMQTYVTPRSSSDSDPLAQRIKVGAKVAFGTIILQQDSLVRYETTSSVDFSSDFNP